MPIYQYRCECEHVFTELKKIADRATHECPECGVTAKQEITPIHLDYLSMGRDPDSFPTAGDKWAKIHEQDARVKNQKVRDHGH